MIFTFRGCKSDTTYSQIWGTPNGDKTASGRNHQLTLNLDHCQRLYPIVELSLFVFRNFCISLRLSDILQREITLTWIELQYLFFKKITPSPPPPPQKVFVRPKNNKKWNCTLMVCMHFISYFYCKIWEDKDRALFLFY